MWLGALVGIAIILLIVVWLQSRRRTLTAAQQRQIATLWQKVEVMTDPGAQVLEADKVLDRALQFAGYTGSLGEKLRQAGPRLPNENAVWKAHKLRNQLAHEPGFRVSSRQANQATHAIRQAIDCLL